MITKVFPYNFGSHFLCIGMDISLWHLVYPKHVTVQFEQLVRNTTSGLRSGKAPLTMRVPHDMGHPVSFL